MDATCKIQDSILVFSLVRKYVSRILGTYHVSKTISITILFNSYIWIFLQKSSKIKAFRLHSACGLTSSPDLPLYMRQLFPVYHHP